VPRAIGRFFCVPLIFAAIAVWPSLAPGHPSPSTTTSALSGTQIRSVFVRVPRNIPIGGHPYQVLLALHGMGGNGETFSKDLTEPADRYGWLIVAPTIEYGDWTNPDVVAREDPQVISALAEYLDQLPARIGLQVQRQVLVLGHSRGAQLAHRFAEFNPEKVLAVAALSAGTYTLPQTSGAAFPFALEDMPRYAGHAFNSRQFSAIQFWVGVGGLDTNAVDLPRQWDSIEGTNRLERAQAFEAAMQKLGASSILRVFGNTGHGITSEMRQAACAFLRGASQARTPPEIVLPLEPITY
jgi:pimeloyl-ACP methyl ester carboxylesterase